MAGVYAALEKLLKASPRPQATSGQTVGDWLETWLRHKSGVIRESTLLSYRQVVERHLKPVIGQVRLEALQAQHVDLLHQSIRDKGLAFRTLEYAHVLLQGALEYAVRLDLLASNVAQKVGLPRGRNTATPILRVWTLAQTQQFVQYLKNPEHRLYAFFHTALTTGMRRGELVGLRWSEVDLEQGLIRVNTSITVLKGKKLFAQPKTRAGHRVIALSAEANQVLKDHKNRQHGEKEKQGVKWQEQALVFPSKFGGPLDSSNLSRIFHQLAQAAGVPRIRLHDLRHTHASLLVLKGVSAKVISDRLGHSQVGFTLQVYTHVYDEQRKQAAVSFQELLNGSSGEQG